MKYMCFALTLALVCFLSTQASRALAEPGKEEPIAQGEHLGARSDEYSRVFDKAVTCLVKGDASCFRALLSSVTVTQETRGPGAIDVIIQDRFIPYFKDFDKLTDKTETLPNYDVAGHTGLAICRSFVTTGGEKKSFVLFVNQENDRYVVGNLLLDTTMEDLLARRKK